MELKDQIIQEYLNTGCGFRKLQAKYGISRTTICKWVSIYQGVHNFNKIFSIISCSGQGIIKYPTCSNTRTLCVIQTGDKTIMTMNKIIFGLGLLIILTIFSCTSKQTIDEKFNGTYRLDKFESFDSASGKWTTDNWRGKYTDGFIQYDGKGHMSVHLYPGDYKDFDTNKNIDSLNQESLKELARFYQSNFVYFAKYKIINDSTIEHHRISATEPKNFGTTLTRSFEFINDTLILTAHESLDNKKMRLRWVKL